MKLSANKLVKFAHLALAKAGLALHADLGKTSLAYRKMLNSLCGIAVGDITLKRLKLDAANLPYFRMSVNSDDYAQAIWDGKKVYIAILEEAEQQRQATEAESTDSTSTDTSTS